MTISLETFLLYASELEPLYDSEKVTNIPISGMYFSTPDTNFPEHNTIYLCDYKKLASTREKNPGFIVFTILPKDTSVDYEANTIYFPHSTTFMTIINKYHKMMQHFTHWDKNMHELLLSGCSFEEFVSRGSSIIKLPMQFFDPSLNVIHFETTDTTLPSEFYNSASIGYTPPDIFFKIQRSNVLQQLQNSKKAVVKPAFSNEKDFVIYRCHKVYHTVVAYTLIYCGEQQPHKGFVNICELFFNNLDLYYLMIHKHQASSSNIYEFFLSSLMASLQTENPKWLEDRAKSAQISIIGNFQLVKLVFKDTTESNAYVYHLLQRQFPQLQSLLYEGDLYFLLTDKTINTKQNNLKDLFESINHLLSRYNFNFYISNRFTDLPDIFFAKKQCDEMQEIVTTKYIQTDKQIYYEDFMLYHCFHAIEKDYHLDFLLWTKYKQICQYDTQYHTNYVDTIKIFMKHNGNLKETADALNMHRNSIDKRIKKIEFLFDINLGDFKTILQLQLSIALSEYK